MGARTGSRESEYRSSAGILINVAGTNVRRRMQDYTAEEYTRILDTNLHGIFKICQQIGGAMVERGKGGKIIHIGSLMSLLGLPYLAPYAISKAHRPTRASAPQPTSPALPSSYPAPARTT